MRRALLLLPLTALLVMGACASSPSTPPWAEDMLSQVNSARAAAGVDPVQLCDSLTRAAQSHSEDQASTERMSHSGSDGSDLRQRAEGAGYASWSNLGENVAAGQPDVGSVMGSWMNSTGHKANILGATYQHLGIGNATSASGTRYWTQDFGRSGSC
jgi:uncharacterized protein YkwD